MNKLRFAFAAALVLFVTASFAQTAANSTSSSNSASQAQTGPVQAGATTGAVTLQLTQEAAKIPTATTANIVQSGHARVDTTASVFLPGNAVASGGFNCGGTGSAGIGGTGFSIGGSASKSLSACVYMNLMNFGIQGNDKEMYLAALCSMDEGKVLMTEAGRKCPSEIREEQARAAQGRNSSTAGPSARPLVGTMDSMGRIVQ